MNITTLRELVSLNKLYLNDSYIKSFNSNIINVVKDNGNILIILDKTAFYPEGGGQPADSGTIGDCRIGYVYEKDDVIYHVADKEPLNLENVACTIDWGRRFDHMQQHSGQHILSAAFEKLLNGKTVGFHLGTDYVTVDISIDSLSVEEAARVELFANEIVFLNIPVKLHYPDADELSNFDLRKAPSVTQDIRIVEIEGFDFSPCGGTHPKLTGDIGLIKIRKWENNKDNIRVEFVCGKRALLDYSWKNEYINELSSLISTKDTELLENVKKAVNELHTANREIKGLKDKVLSYEASELYSAAEELKGVRVIKQLFSGRDFKEITSLAGKITKLNSAIALLGLKSDTAQMVFTRSQNVDIKINELFKETLPLINGKGGGNPMSAQGGGSDISNLGSALDSAYIILKNRYLK